MTYGTSHLLIAGRGEILSGGGSRENIAFVCVCVGGGGISGGVSKKILLCKGVTT